MIELLRYKDFTRVAYFRDLLEDAEIQTFIRNENVSSSEGPYITDFFPALCIVNDEDQERALRLIKDNLQSNPEAVSGEVVCKDCGESSPANFDTCWNCGAGL